MAGGKIVWPGPHPSLTAILSVIEKERDYDGQKIEENVRVVKGKI
jgi:hypothetical protein